MKVVISNYINFLLGSASRDLLQHSSETLAGRIRYLELAPFSALEIFKTDGLGFNPEKLWFRGGFPNSYLATSDDESWEWRNDFISTYVERDIPLMGPQIPATRMKKFWTMLAHYHGQQIVFSELGKNGNTAIIEQRHKLKLISYWKGLITRYGQSKLKDHQLRKLARVFILPVRI